MSFSTTSLSSHNGSDGSSSSLRLEVRELALELAFKFALVVLGFRSVSIRQFRREVSLKLSVRTE